MIHVSLRKRKVRDVLVAALLMAPPPWRTRMGRASSTETVSSTRRRTTVLVAADSNVWAQVNQQMRMQSHRLRKGPELQTKTAVRVIARSASSMSG